MPRGADDAEGDRLHPSHERGISRDRGGGHPQSGVRLKTLSKKLKEPLTSILTSCDLN